MFRKLLLKLLKMTDKYPQKVEEVTDWQEYTPTSISVNSLGGGLIRNGTTKTSTPAIIPQEVNLVQAEEIVQMWNNSPVIHNVRHMTNTILNSNNYKLNRFEIQILDGFIEEYSTKYKSPLAKALSENTDATSSDKRTV